MIKATLFSDPACPWAYSANPALRVLEWRYGDQLDWRLVTIGLREDNSACSRASIPRARRRATRSSTASTACRSRSRPRSGPPAPAAAAARSSRRGCSSPGASGACCARSRSRNFTTQLLLDDDERIREALRGLPGLDADAIARHLDSPEVVEAYERDKAEARQRRRHARRGAGQDVDL